MRLIPSILGVLTLQLSPKQATRLPELWQWGTTFMVSPGEKEDSGRNGMPVDEREQASELQCFHSLWPFSTRGILLCLWGFFCLVTHSVSLSKCLSTLPLNPCSHSVLWQQSPRLLAAWRITSLLLFQTWLPYSLSSVLCLKGQVSSQSFCMADSILQTSITFPLLLLSSLFPFSCYRLVCPQRASWDWPLSWKHKSQPSSLTKWWTPELAWVA